MDQIGILHHPRIPESEPLSKKIGDWLENNGHDFWAASTWEEDLVQASINQSKLLIVLGGDGSLLRAARMAVQADVPIFGINMGRVGFLSEAQLNDWPTRLTRVLGGDYWIEERLLIRAELLRNHKVVDQFTALNDLVIGRGQQARVVRFQLWVDGDMVTTYTADALIVSTPTGSTAYAMAAGGPLLPPQLQNFVVLPVAPHLTFNRSLVLHEEAEIVIDLDMDHEAYLTPDGQHGVSLQSGDKILIRKNDKRCKFARVESSGYFYRRLMGRLGYTR
ncbi:MAG: NAD(+)/NADH kinase [Chloroflexota bacterium]